MSGVWFRVFRFRLWCSLWSASGSEQTYTVSGNPCSNVADVVSWLQSAINWCIDCTANDTKGLHQGFATMLVSTAVHFDFACFVE